MTITKSLPLDSDHFNYDLTPGFEMAVEKNWNVIDCVDVSKDFPIFDANLEGHSPTKYAARLFFKAVIPMYYIDNTYPNPLVIHDSDQDVDYFDFINGTPLGVPVNKMDYDKMLIGSDHGYHGLILSDNVPYEKEAYALPSYRQLNNTNVLMNAFATGSSIATCQVTKGTDVYQQPVNIEDYDIDDKRFAYLFMNNDGTDKGGVSGFQISNNTLAYSVDTSANRLNVPNDNDYDPDVKYLQPMLFKPFGMSWIGRAENNTIGWLYCVIGVKEITSDPEVDVHVAPVPGSEILFDTQVSDMQSNVNVYGEFITGSLSYFEDGIAESGPLHDGHWFLALQFSNIPDDADSVKVGLEPNYGTGLVELDSDLNCVMNIHENTQMFIVQTTIGSEVYRQEFDLRYLNLEAAPTPETGPLSWCSLTIEGHTNYGVYDAEVSENLYQGTLTPVADPNNRYMFSLKKKNASDVITVDADPYGLTPTEGPGDLNYLLPSAFSLEVYNEEVYNLSISVNINDDPEYYIYCNFDYDPVE